MFKRVVLVLIILLCLLSSVQAARFPIIGGDGDNWGTILNDLLNVSLDDGGYLEADTVNSTHILDSSVSSDDVNESAINTTHILDGSLISQDIATDAINASHILNYSVLSQHVMPGAIMTAHLANNSIDVNKLQASSVNSTHIIDTTIQGEDIADGVITGDHINSTTNITANVINATRVILNLTTATDDCNVAFCTATATCPAGMNVLFGMSASTSIECDTAPLNCGNYCIPGDTDCSITATVAGLASVYVVCGNV